MNATPVPTLELVCPAVGKQMVEGQLLAILPGISAAVAGLEIQLKPAPPSLPAKKLRSATVARAKAPSWL